MRRGKALVSPGEARLGLAVMARSGWVRSGLARTGVAVEVWLGSLRRGTVRRDEAGAARTGLAGRGLVGRGADRPSSRMVMTGPELKALRKSLGLSLAQAARQVEVSARSWARWEAGTQKIPDGPVKLFKLLNKVIH